MNNMGTLKHLKQLLACLTLLLHQTQSAVHDLTPNDRPTLYRQARDDRYFQNRYGATNLDRPLDRTLERDSSRGRRPTLKPGEAARPEARGEGTNEQNQGTGVEKRCIRCTTSYLDPYDYRDYHDRYYDRYDDRGGYGGGGGYSGGGGLGGGYGGVGGRYEDRYYDRYDRSYYDRDRWYDRRPAYEDRSYYDRGYDRGFGYDNRGYDNRAYRANDYRGGFDRGGYDRGAYDRGAFDRGGYDRGGYDRGGYDRGVGGYRPWDETGRGASGWDTYGRGGGGMGGAGGYANRPDYWGYDRNYASNYYYGRGDTYRDPYRRYDPYEGYRGTSYLYERQPTPVTTARPLPTKEGDAVATERPESEGKPESNNT